MLEVFPHPSPLCIPPPSHPLLIPSFHPSHATSTPIQHPPIQHPPHPNHMPSHTLPLPYRQVQYSSFQCLDDQSAILTTELQTVLHGAAAHRTIQLLYLPSNWSTCTQRCTHTHAHTHAHANSPLFAGRSQPGWTAAPATAPAEGPCPMASLNQTLQEMDTIPTITTPPDEHSPLHPPRTILVQF